MCKWSALTVAAVAIAIGAGGCVRHLAPDEPKQSNIGRGRRLPRASAQADAGGVPQGVSSHVIASVPEHTVGPLLARGLVSSMAAYLGAAPNGTRRIVTIPLRSDGSPLDAHVIATTGPDSTTFVLRPAGGGGEGFVAAWTDLTDRGEALSIAGIGRDGIPVVAPVEVARSINDVVWVEIVPTPRGSVVVWAEETRGGGADIGALALDSTGKPRGVASRVAQGVLGWQAMPTVAGVALGLVVPTPAQLVRPAVPRPPGPAGLHATTGPQPSSITLLKLDADGRPVAPAVTVASVPFSIADADVARAGGGFFFAWTDRSGTDPVVMTAFLDPEGKPSPARAVTNGSGGAMMTAITGGPGGALLAWEESTKRSKALRRIHFTRIDASGAPHLGADTVLEVDGSAAPELTPNQDGFALLARVRACAVAPPPPTEPDKPRAPAKPATEPSCDSNTPILPAVIRLDSSLAVTSTEPLQLSETNDAAQIAWGLGCDGSRCSALAATGDAPVRVSAVELEPRPSRYRAPTPQAGPAGAPHLETVQTFAAGADFADLAAATVGDHTLVATLTSALDEPGKNGASAQGTAVLALRVVGADGRAQGAPVVVTKRAIASGGLAVSAGGRPEDGAALAWVDRDDGDLEVHVAHVDPNGKPVRDVRLTMAKGDASDVSIAWADGGWLLAWVDTRDGNGEVYAAKVGLDLQRLAHDERITNAPGDASDVTLLADGGDAWLAWADPRESPHDGFADIFVLKLHGKDAKPTVRESRVLPTAAHSRSPSLARGDEGGVVVGWIEEAPMGFDATNNGAYGAMIAWLDDKGQAIGDPVRSKGGGEGSPTSIVLDRTGAELHAVIARSGRDELTLDALSPGRGGAGPAFPILALDGPPSLDIAMTLLGNALYFNDDGPETGDGRARRAMVVWSR